MPPQRSQSSNSMRRSGRWYRLQRSTPAPLEFLPVQKVPESVLVLEGDLERSHVLACPIQRSGLDALGATQATRELLRGDLSHALALGGGTAAQVGEDGCVEVERCTRHD